RFARFPRSAETEQTRKARIGEKKIDGTTSMKAILGCTALALAVAATTVSRMQKAASKAPSSAASPDTSPAIMACWERPQAALSVTTRPSARRHCNRRTSNAQRLFASPCSHATGRLCRPFASLLYRRETRTAATARPHRLMDVELNRARTFFGRRKGHKLRKRQAELFDTLLPRLAIDLSGPAPTELRTLFPVPVTGIELE